MGSGIIVGRVLGAVKVGSVVEFLASLGRQRRRGGGVVVPWGDPRDCCV